jgi:hypothetical protein
MELFKLPSPTRVQKVIPKNAFDAYTTTRQKKLFSDLVARITWLHKLSPDTINLEAKDIKEIQIFKVELKAKKEIQPLLNIIDKAIPYHIIFIVEFENSFYLCASLKHPHPVNNDNAVIDCTFRSAWFVPEEKSFVLHLRKDLDAVLHDFCTQISENPDLSNLSMHELIHYKKRTVLLEKEIEKLKKEIRNSKQYKIKVQLNLLLNQKTNELKKLNPKV